MTATKRAAVLGSPIAHSLSPALHRAAYRKLGLDWTYDAIDVPKDQFTRVLAELLTDPSLVGLSVTMPLKELALAAAQEATVIARQTQAANTLIVGANSLSADNTDPDGIIWALTRAGLAGRVSHAGIIGAGATARSAVAALTKLGAHTLYVVARRPEAIAELSKVAESFGARVVPTAWDAPEDVLAAPVVVSTVPGRAADDLAHADCFGNRLARQRWCRCIRSGNAGRASGPTGGTHDGSSTSDGGHVGGRNRGTALASVLRPRRLHRSTARKIALRVS